MPKLLKSTCRKLWCLSACKKLTSYFTSFLRHYKDWLAILGSLGILEHSHHTTNFWKSFTLIYVQKINFIAQFFLKILQRNSKPAILGNLDMSGHTHTPKVTVPIWRNLWCLSACKKNNFILHVFLEILQRSWKLVILSTLSMPAMWYY